MVDSIKVACISCGNVIPVNGARFPFYIGVQGSLATGGKIRSKFIPGTKIKYGENMEIGILRRSSLIQRIK